MRVSYTSLGCPKNLVDTENVLGILASEGLGIEDNPPGDLHIINTCAFIEPAVKESVDEILKAERLKDEGLIKGFFIMGCLVERYGKKRIKELFPSADGVFGVPKDPQAVASSIVGRKVNADPKRYITTLPYAYLRIGDGCSRRCSFCIIPKLRGKLVNRDLDDIVKEAEFLAACGAKEIIVVSQDTTQFRSNRGEGLAALIERLDAALKDVWIRVMYMHPGGFKREVLDAVGGSSSVVRYFDIPIQHASDRILSLMRRGYRRRHLEALYRSIRDSFPDAVLRTTVMVGFPGEGRAEFEELLSFIRDHPFEYLGGFTYFDEDGASSRRIRPKVRKRVREERLERIYSLQEPITERLLGRFVGRELDVLLEGDGTGRFYGQAPEIDGIVLCGDGKTGEFKRVMIKGIDGYDLVA